MALQARGIGADGTREKERRAGGRVALSDQFLFRFVVAKRVDDVRFPIYGPVAKVGGVQGGFFVGVIGVGAAEVVEALGGREGRYGLRQERALMLLLHFEQRLDLRGGVSARGHHGLHHEPRLAEHFLPRLILQEAVG